MLGRKNKLKASFANIQVRPRLARRVDGVIVEHHKYHTFLRISLINQLQKIDEVGTFVPFANQAMHLAGDQIDAGKKR